MIHDTLRIASRGSELALWQTNWVVGAVAEAHPGLRCEVDVIRTTGDVVLDVPLAKIGDRGLFTKELDAALLASTADIAVHSLKDVPTRLPAGLALLAVTEREDPRDVLIGPQGAAVTLRSLPPRARVGTSSLRRRAQLAAIRPDLEVVDLRGNLNTRLRKLDEGGYDAIILAAAGVIRLGWRERISDWLDPDEWIPAVGQGALAIVGRANDLRVAETISAIHHEPTATAVTTERAFLRALEGGCQVPIGARAWIESDSVVIDGFVSDLSGREMLRDLGRGLASEPTEIGTRLADALIERGAAAILERVRAEHGAPPVAGP